MSYGPPCACHGLRQLWHKDRRCRDGGWWYCAELSNEKKREARRRKAERRRELSQLEARRIRRLEESLEMWKQRALAAEWGLKQAHVRTTYKNEPYAGENGVEMRVHKIGDITRADRTVAA